MGEKPSFQSAFVCKGEGPYLQLVTDVTVISDPESTKVKALWDTGATGTCISEDVVEELGLEPTGRTRVRTPSGISDFNTYLVDIVLPNNIKVKDVRVTESKIGDQGIGVLIGMNIITRGDFAVSCYEGKTCFTFRTPSQECADYTKPIKIQNVIGQKHGRGKYRHKKKK